VLSCTTPALGQRIRNQPVRHKRITARLSALFCSVIGGRHIVERKPHPWSHAKQTIDKIHNPPKMGGPGSISRQGTK
jgi:hypothetical protein